MNDVFKVGDIVRLRSGGPEMTVHISGSDPNNRAGLASCCFECRWFDGGKVRSAMFHAGTIVKTGQSMLPRPSFTAEDHHGECE